MTFWKKYSNEKNNQIERTDRTPKPPLWSIGVAVGVLCLVIGFFGDQFTDMYRKAVMICLECIGSG